MLFAAGKNRDIARQVQWRCPAGRDIMCSAMRLKDSVAKAVQRHASPDDPTMPKRCVLVVLSLPLVACGYGPPESHASISSYGTSPNGGVTVALRDFDVIRPPRGLSRFPDGGFSKGLDQGVEVNVCDKASGTFRRISVIHDPELAQPRYSTPRIVEWLDSAIRITRYTGGDTVVRLPSGLHAGAGRDGSSDRLVIPECETSLKALRSSNQMPDGTPTTPSR